ncbi:MAG: type II toxin-antitoxin system mRNA interferase toxin, RelE/StbE family [Parcubacteria group bacterium CG_4_10_14_0_8_um_filter_35_7]|nr:MAG: type II toxin-antitoxin system mRNA interferase toxin, RelE/StbE family [Parcubacteria group bacterium CG_4_10_14_0_8_um_filter_35_7]
MKIYYHSQFFKSYKFLDGNIKRKAEIKEKIFRINPFHPSLKTHKLSGKLKNQWSFSVDDKHRILFEFDNDDVIFFDIGAHEIYK